MEQKEKFLAGEGDRYFRRNADRLQTSKDDIVLCSLRNAGVAYSNVLEIGCATGHRLAAMVGETGMHAAGIDPSGDAVAEGKRLYPNLDLVVGTADSIPFDDNAFDLVIFGFCFYLIDPQLHFRVVAEADRVLVDGGRLAILDFITPFPYANDYTHLTGLKAHKMEFSRYFSVHPSYSLISRQIQYEAKVATSIDNRIGVDLLQKEMTQAFPPNPFRNL